MTLHLIAKAETMRPKPAQFAGSDEEWATAQRKAAERRAAQQSQKSAGQAAKQATVDVSTKRKIPLHAHINPRQAVNAGISLGLAGAASHLAHRRRQEGERKKAAGYGAVGGAAGMDAAYVVGGQAAKARIKHVQQSRGFTPAEQARWAEHKQAAGLSPGEKITGRTSPKIKHKVFAHYPRELPAWRAQRALGWKNNSKVSLAAYGAAASAGAAHAGRQRNVNKSVGTALVAIPQMPAPGLDVTERVAGSALLAWGLPRVKMTGPALSAGRNMARAGGARNVAAMFDDARALATQVENVTRRGEMGLRRSKAISEMIDAVPAGVRGEVATAAGLLLVSAPRRRERRHEAAIRRSGRW